MKPVTLMTNGQTSSSTTSTHLLERLRQHFYTLRTTFEADYSGALTSHKYEETRSFTISLNYAIFQANSLASQESVSSQNLLELQTRLNSLKSEFTLLRGY